MTNERTADRNLTALQAAIRPLFEGLEVRSHFSVAPTANAGGPYNVAEGQSVLISGLTSSDSDGTVASYQWDTNYSVSKGFKNRIGGGTWTFTADNSGSRTIALRVVDNNGDVSAIQTATINIGDVAPTITLTAPGTANEASPVNVSWSYTDPGSLDAVTAWDVDWGDGTTSTYAGNVAAASHTYEEDGNYVMTLTATQADGQTDVTHNITIANVPAIIEATAPSTSIDEGEMVQMDFTSPNRGGTLDGWTIDWGDGNTELLSATRSHAAHLYRDSGTYNAILTAMEPDGGSSSTTLTYTVGNVAPTVAITGTPTTGTEGSAVSVGSTVTDAGLDDTQTYGWTVYRNGEHFTLPGGTTLNGQTFTFTPTDDGSYVIRLSVMDDEGAITTVNSTAITVGNVNPTAVISGEPVGAISEGTAVNLTATPGDAGAEDTFSYAWTVTKNGSAFALPENAITNTAGFTFTPTDNGTYVATVVVTDDNSGFVSVSSTSITVDNVAPVGSIAGTPVTAEEGDTVTVGSTLTDAGTADTATYAWTVTKDGNPVDLTGVNTTGTAFSFVPTDNGDYVITLVVTDDDGDADTVTSSTISVTNVAPTASVAGNSTGTEGNGLNFSVAPVDAGASDSHTFAWTVTKGGVNVDLTGVTVNAANFAFTPADNGTYVVNCEITDDDGAVINVSKNVTVGNVAPVAAITGTPANGTEGSVINLGSTVTDVAADTQSHAWTVARNGSTFTLPGGVDASSSTFAFTPTDNGDYVVSLVVTDTDGDTDTVATDVIEVTNAAPTAVISGEPVGPVNEGAPVSLTANPTDDGSEDTFTYAWTVTKDGSPFVLPENAVTNTAGFTFTPTDNGSYIATVVVSDDDGDTVTVATAAITVDNVAPTASITGVPVTAAEGSTISVGSTASDAGTADTLSYAWSVMKDGDPVNLTGTNTTGSSFAFVPADNGSYEITLVVTDKDSATVTKTSSAITVTNAAPTATLTAPSTGTEGTALIFGVDPHDAGSVDTHTYLWTVTKDGDAYDLNGATDNAAVFGFTPDDNGSYEVSVVVTDNDGDSVTKTATINVVNAHPVVALTGVPTTGTEGQSISVGSTVTDAGVNDTFDYAWTVTKGNEAVDLTGITTTNSSFAFTPADNGSYVLTLVVTDNGGGTRTISSAAIVVDNVDPTGTVSGEPIAPLGEGAQIDLSATPADDGVADTFGYAWTITKDGLAWTPLAGTTLNDADLSFVPTDNGTYIATVVITDDDGGSVSVSSQPVLVTNSDPSATITGAPANSAEGTTLDLGTSVLDDGAADTFTYAWSVTKDGDPIDLTGSNTTGASFNYTPRDNGTYVISLTVVDDDGGTTNTSATVAVTNAAPVPTIAGNSSVNEGQAITVTATPHDPGTDDTHLYSWSVTRNGSAYNTGLGATNAAAFTFTPNLHGTYVATVVVTDNNGSTATVTQSITVNNVAPTVAVTGAPTGPRGEGSPLTFGSTVSDVSGENGLTYAWSVKRGGLSFALPNTVVTTGTTFEFEPTDNGLYRVTLAVTDSGGLTTTSTTNNITVTNALPDASISGTPLSPVAEGSAINLTVDAADPGSEDTLSYAWTVTKDGQAYTLPNGTVTNAAAFAFIPVDQGTYVARVIVTDDDNGPVTVSTSNITVTNVAPTVVINDAPNTNLDEGTIISLTATGTDPGTADVLKYSWSVTKDGQSFGTATASTTNTGFNFRPTDNGTYVVTVVANDGHDTHTVSTAPIAIDNVAPTGTIAGPATSAEGSAVTVTATASDAGSADTRTYAWSITKDGNAVTLPNGMITNAESITYMPADQGDFEFTCVITDDDGDSITLTHDLTATNVNPTISQTNVPSTGKEGTAITVGSTASDPGDDTLTHGWTVYRDGDHYTLADGTVLDGDSFSFTPTDNGSYVIRLSVIDEDGGIKTVNSDPIVVGNVAPVAIIADAASVAEGTEAGFTPNITDAGQEDVDAGFTYAWTATRGKAVVASGDAAEFNFTPTVHGDYSITLIATDKDGMSTTTNSSITVTNVAPSDLAITKNDEGGYTEGDTASFSLSAVDAEDDMVSYSWQVFRGENVFASGTGAEAEFAVARGGYELVATATDSAGETTTTSHDFYVDNAAPEATLNGPQETLLVGSQAVFGLSINDVPANQAFTVTWDFGDKDTATVDYTGDTLAVRKHTFTAAGTYTVTASISDGVDVTVVTTTVIVSNAILTTDPADTSKSALIVLGTADSDVINVTQNSNGRYTVNVNGSTQGTAYRPTGRIYVYGNGGSNTINVSGANNAVVFAGSGAGNVTTGSGNDVIVGSSGIDRLNGGDGRDVVIGGLGADILRGGDGEDLLIAGGVKSVDVNSLKSAADKWTTSQDLATRRKALSSVFGKQLIADNGSNQLYGEAKNDWFLTNAQADRLRDLQKTDLVN